MLSTILIGLAVTFYLVFTSYLMYIATLTTKLRPDTTLAGKIMYYYGIGAMIFFAVVFGFAMIGFFTYVAGTVIGKIMM